MLQLVSAGKRFGPRLLFENANWLITPGEKTALVGANGTGKSTVMKVLAGLESLDYGSTEGARNTSIGYLPQDYRLVNGSLRDNLLLGLPDPGDDRIMEVAQKTGLAGMIHPPP